MKKIRNNPGVLKITQDYLEHKKKSEDYKRRKYEIRNRTRNNLNMNNDTTKEYIT